MKRMMKTLVMALSLSMVIGLILMGCGQSTQKEESKSETPPSTATTKEDLKEVTVKFYGVGEMPKDMPVLLEEIEKKAKDELNIKFEPNFIPANDYVAKLNVLISSGDKFDFCGMGNWGNFAQFSNNGAFLDISDLAKTYAPILYKTYGPIELQACSVRGELYGLPKAGVNNLHTVVTLRADVAEKAGISADNVKTFEDLEAALIKVKAMYPDDIPLAMYQGFIVERQNYLNSKGYVELDNTAALVYKWDDPDMKVMGFEQTPEFKDFVTMMHRWNVEGLIAKNQAANTADTATLLKSGKYLGYIHNYNMFNRYSKLIKSFVPESNGAIGIVLYPGARYPKTMPDANMLSFNRNAANPERAMMFLNWMYESRDNFDLVNYGIKDKHYVLKGDFIAQPEGMTDVTNPYFSSNNYSLPGLALQTPGFYRERVEDEEFLKVKEAAAVNTQYYPHTGFQLNTDIVKTEYVKRLSVWNSTGKPVCAGVIPPEEIGDFINSLNGPDYDKLIAEVQKQLDDWRNSNKK